MKALAVCMFVCACGSTAEDPKLHVERVALPDATQAPFEVTSGDGRRTTCEEADCALALTLPVEPVTLELLDALGNTFSLPIVELGEGKHSVSEPLAPEAGVFLEYTLEYSVR